MSSCLWDKAVPSPTVRGPTGAMCPGLGEGLCDIWLWGLKVSPVFHLPWDGEEETVFWGQKAWWEAHTLLGYWLGKEESSGSSDLAWESPILFSSWHHRLEPQGGVGAGCETGHLNSSLDLSRIHRQGTRSVWTWVFPPVNWGALQHSFQYHQGADKTSETADPPENDWCHLAPPLGRLPALLPATPSPLSCPDRGEWPMRRAPPRAPRGLAATPPESTFLLH